MFTSTDMQKRLKDAGLARLIPAYMQTNSAGNTEMGRFNDGLARMIDFYFEDCLERKFESNLANADLPFVGINVNDVDLQVFPQLNWYLLEQIRSGQWVKQGRCVLLHGNTGNEQLRLGSAIASELMLQGLSLRCCSLKDLTYQILKAQSQKLAKKTISAFKKHDVLFIHDFEPANLTPMECYWLSNLLDARKVGRGFLISSSSTPAQWREELDDVGLVQRIQSVIEPELIKLAFNSKSTKEEAHD